MPGKGPNGSRVRTLEVRVGILRASLAEPAPGSGLGDNGPDTATTARSGTGADSSRFGSVGGGDRQRQYGQVTRPGRGSELSMKARATSDSRRL